jgi:predicted RNase H-like HicB family nuclease
MQYTVIVHNAEEGGYGVEVPLLPGCYGQGETIDEALSNVAKRLRFTFEA